MIDGTPQGVGPAGEEERPESRFRRIDVDDALFVVQCPFRGQGRALLLCLDALDADDNGQIEVAAEMKNI